MNPISGQLPPTGRRPAPRMQLSEEIAAYLREMIMSGQLAAGEQIYVDALGKEFDTSATPAREALLALRGEGFIHMEPRKGFKIASLTRRDVADLYSVQSYIAGELAARAAADADKELTETLNQTQELMRKAAAKEAADEVEHLNFEFHRAINRAAESPKLTWLLGVVVRYVPRRFYALIPGWMDASVKDHDAIIEAFGDHDADRARTTMSAHINHASKLLEDHLERNGFWDDETS